MENGQLERKLNNDYWVDKLEKVDAVPFSKNALGDLVHEEITIEELHHFNVVTRQSQVLELSVVVCIYSFLLSKYFPHFNNCLLSTGISESEEVLNYQDLHFVVVNYSSRTLKEALQQCNAEVSTSLGAKDRKLEEIYQRIKPDKVKVEDLSFYSLLFCSGKRRKQDKKENCNPFILSFDKVQDLKVIVSVQYRDKFVEKYLVQSFLHNFLHLLTNLRSYLNTPLNQIPLVHERDKRLLEIFNSTDRIFPQEKTIIDVFESQVLISSHRQAAIYKDQNYSYDILNQEVNRFAHFLIANYNVKGQIVGVLMRKSLDALIAILALMKAGAVFLPIDPNYPLERINYLIEDSKLKLLIVDENYNHLCSNTLRFNPSFWTNCSNVNPRISITPDDIAYVIYTSGSTGKPKGVAIRHRSNVNMSLDQIRVFGVDPTDVVIWFASLSFDASISEIMMALYCGAALAVPEDENIKDPISFCWFIKQTRATVVTLPPSYLNILQLEDIKTLKCIITAGEPANAGKALEICNVVRYFNAYGPTECAVCVSTYEVTKNDSSEIPVPIGRPIANLKVLVLDEYHQVVPIGVEGEIYVAGVGLAAGYLNQADLTVKKFIKTRNLDGERLYRTGDRGRWLMSGNLEFIGRVDDQVKIRGYRIEPGEIEFNILQCDLAVHQAAVVATEVGGDLELIAYVAGEGLSTEGLKSFLKGRLPEYMIPSAFMLLEKLPLTIHGKIDKKNLPEYVVTGSQSLSQHTPTDELEQKLLSIWKNVLKQENIGVDADFFNVGGQSLKIALLLQQISIMFNVRLGFGDLFRCNSIRKQAELIRAKINQVFIDYSKFKSPGNKLLASSSQKRIWLSCQNAEASIAHHMSLILEIEGDLDIQDLEESINRCLLRHEILRTSVYLDGKNVMQEIHNFTDIPFKLEVFPHPTMLTNTDNTTDLDAFLISNINTPFLISEGRVLKAFITNQGENRYILQVILHHIAGDEWSASLLRSELFDNYFALRSAKLPDREPLKCQYRNYCLAESYKHVHGNLHQQLGYWKELFRSPMKTITKFQKSDMTYSEFEGGVVELNITGENYNIIKELGKKLNTTNSILFSTFFSILITRHIGINDVVIGMPVALRDNVQLMDQVGPYITVLPIRYTIDSSKSLRDIFLQIKALIENVLVNKDVDIEDVLALIGPKIRPFNYVINVLNNVPSEVSDKALKIKEYNLAYCKSKFPLCLYITESDEVYNIRFEYQKRLFNSAEISKMSKRFLKLIELSPINLDKKTKNIDFNEYKPISAF